MVFVSDSFVFLFLPIFLICYSVSPASLRNVTILIFSLVFYGWWRFDFLPLLVGIACWSWLTGPVEVIRVSSGEVAVSPLLVP